MNRIIVSLSSLLLVAGAAATAARAADPPDTVHYQGVLRNAAGQPLSGFHDMRFRFFDAPVGGEEILVDEHLAATGDGVLVSGGLFGVKLGGGVVIDGAGSSGSDPYGALGAVFRDFGSVWIEIEVDGGGGFETLLPRVEVLASAYAHNAGALGGREASGYLDTSAGAQSKVGPLTVGGLTAENDVTLGGELTLIAPNPSIDLGYGSRLYSDANRLLVFAGEDDTDSLVLSAGNDQDDGGISILGDSSFTLRSGNGLFNFVDGQSISVIAQLNDGSLWLSGNLTSDGDLTVGGGVQVADELAFGDGTVQTSAAFTPERASLLEAAGSIQTPRLAIDADGDPAVIYRRAPDVRRAWCQDPSCATAWRSTLTFNPTRAFSPAMTFLGNSVPAFIYRDSYENELRLGNTVIRTGFWVPEIVTGSDGNPVLAYTNGSVAYLTLCENSACTVRTENPIDSNVGSLSLAIGSDGRPIVSYRRTTGDELWFGRCSNSSCLGVSVRQIPTPGAVGDHDVAVGAGGNPIIAYRDETGQALRMATCDDLSCTSNTDRLLDDVDDAGQAVSVAVPAGGDPIVAYTAGTTPELRVALCNDGTCFGPSTRVLDPGPVASPEIEIAAHGRAALSYEDTANDDVRIITGIVGAVPFSVPARASGGAPRTVVDEGATRMPLPPSSRTGDERRSDPAITAATAARPDEAFGKGADVAGAVEVTGPVEPGDVLVLDPERPGRLRRSTALADPRVVGVAAVEPGLLLGAAFPLSPPSGRTGSAQPGSEARVPLAVGGIVSCKVDAGYGPIRPGDLLTTSPTPGHAQLAHDPVPGTILGKALESLEHGQGTIRILITPR